MKQYILFDLDGTLIDPSITLTRCAQAALASVGIQVEDAGSLLFFIGPPLRDTFREVYGIAPDAIEQAVEVFDAHLLGDGLQGTHVYEGIPAMLKRLSVAGKTLLVATSKPTVLALEIMRHFSLDAYFDVIAGSELDGTRTRKDEVIAHALAQAGIQGVENAIMVGDRRHDVAGAMRHGMDCVGVTFGFGGRKELEEAGATYVVDTVEGLEALLMEL